MLPSFNFETDPLRLVERPMCVESMSPRTIRWAAEHRYLRGFRDPDTPRHKAWRFWRRDVEDWLRRRQQCN